MRTGGHIVQVRNQHSNALLQSLDGRKSGCKWRDDGSHSAVIIRAAGLRHVIDDDALCFFGLEREGGTHEIDRGHIANSEHHALVNANGQLLGFSAGRRIKHEEQRAFIPLTNDLVTRKKEENNGSQTN